MYVTWLFKWVLVYSGLVDVTGNEKQIVQQVKKRLLTILFLNACLILETKSGKLTETVLQLESRNLNSVFSNYLLHDMYMYFELKTISLGFDLQSFIIRFFTLVLSWTIFYFSLEFEIMAGFVYRYMHMYQ